MSSTFSIFLLLSLYMWLNDRTEGLFKLQILLKLSKSFVIACNFYYLTIL